jgi:cystathionine gamma-lyase
VWEVPTAGPWPDLAGAGLVLLETPANPGLDVCDIAALAAAAHGAARSLAVDNTTATPLGQRPLELGADLTLASDTKALAGHDDVVLGHVSTRDPALAARLRELRTRAGAGPGPMEAWLAHRGLATLDLRLARQAANAAALVEVLRGTRPSSRCGGRATPPTRPTTSPKTDAQVERGGRGDVGVRGRGGRFLAASRLVASATSFGGVRTSADRRQRWGDAVPPDSSGFPWAARTPDDLVADLRPRWTRAISPSRNPPGLWSYSRREVVA